MKSSDKELLEKITQKEYSAFNTLYERYNRLFIQWVYLRTKDTEVTKDVCQLFWENLWNNTASFRTASDGSAKNSFLKILSFRIIDYLRSPQGRKESATAEVWKEIERNFTYNHVLETIEVNELQEIITDTLYEMPLLLQQIIELRWGKQLCSKEIATQLGLSEKTVNKKYKEAKQLLKRKLYLIYQDEEMPLLAKAKLLSLLILLQANLMLLPSLRESVVAFTAKTNHSFSLPEAAAIMHTNKELKKP